jgi:molybdopterin-binding protein
MEDDSRAAQEVSPLVDYLIREERAHGRKSREIFKASDLRDSLLRKSSERMVLKSTDGKGSQTVKGKARVRYEANNQFTVSEVTAFGGRFSGDAIYTPGQEEEWHWDVFPPPEPDELFRARIGSLARGLIGQNKALTSAERSEVQAMVQMAMADYLGLDKTKQLIAEIDSAEVLVDEEWRKEQAMYTAKFGIGGDDDRPRE